MILGIRAQSHRTLRKGLGGSTRTALGQILQFWYANAS